MSQPTAASKPRTPKKGDTIYVVGTWTDGLDPRFPESYGRPTVHIRELRVECWGKVQAHFTDPASGEFIKERGYTAGFAFAWSREQALAELVPAEIEAVRRQIAGSIRCDERWQATYGPTARPEIVARNRRGLEHARRALEAEVVVADRNELWGRPVRFEPDATH